MNLNFIGSIYVACDDLFLKRNMIIKKELIKEEIQFKTVFDYLLIHNLY